jgi:DNA-binding transcriptional regulator PaaX
MAKHTIIGQLLLALVPYSKPNLALSFQPKRYFADLAKQTGASKQTLVATYGRAKRQGLIEVVNGRPYLTEAGKGKIAINLQPLLEGGLWLMVIFDISEHQRVSRAKLRSYLKDLGYKPLQRSVWVSDHDNLALVKDAVAELGLGSNVEILRCEPVFPYKKFESVPESLHNDDEAI